MDSVDSILHVIGKLMTGLSHRQYLASEPIDSRRVRREWYNEEAERTSSSLSVLKNVSELGTDSRTFAVSWALLMAPWASAAENRPHLRV